MVLQQSELQQLRRYPSTAELRQNQQGQLTILIGRRLDVPAAVGPTVNMYSGEARESHLAGIAAHDGGSGVLNPSFDRQPRVIPPVLKGGKSFQIFKTNIQARFSSESEHVGYF